MTDTKKALADAFKELVKEKNFNKISISDITDLCHMNRKSFYYHFKDKYELMAWIFENEFISDYNKRDQNNPVGIFISLADYFYENKEYYSKIFKIEGQNSFSDYFRQLIEPMAKTKVKEILPEYESDFFVTFICDGITSSFMRWITSRNCMEPETFVNMLQDFTKRCALKTLESE